MKRTLTAFLVIVTLGLFGQAWFGFGASEAKAQGLHVQTRGLHLDIGNVYHGYRGYGIRAGGCVVPPPRTCYDYRPPRVVRHGNHYHYAPRAPRSVYRTYPRGYGYPGNRGRGGYLPYYPYR